jgi:hypothetical protein
VGSHLVANKDEHTTATTEFFDPVSQPYTCENNKGLTPLNDKKDSKPGLLPERKSIELRRKVG